MKRRNFLKVLGVGATIPLLRARSKLVENIKK